MTLIMEESTQENVEEPGDCKPYNFTVVPFSVEQHLEFIDICDDGYLLLGSSNLVLNCWTGSIWYFKNPDFAPKKEKSVTGHGCSTGLSCGKFLNDSSQIIVGDDSGAVSVFTITTFENDTTHIIPQMTSLHHDSSVTTLSVMPDKKQSVTGGTDRTINVWDNESLVSEHRYSPAHTRSISCIVAGTDESNPMFVSCSLDGLALLWDPRISKAASCIKQVDGFGMTALSWKNNNEIAIGTETGNITISDIRSRSDVLNTPIMECPLHNIVFDNKGLLAVCGDSNNVAVWDSVSQSIVYSDERHTGLVRGLAWHPQSHKLYSCGFDKNVFSHQIKIDS